MSFHFGAVTVYSYGSDTIVIESESDADSESEDAKKENKLVSLYEINSGVTSTENERQVIFVDTNWNMPHLEVTSPPPDAC